MAAVFFNRPLVLPSPLIPLPFTLPPSTSDTCCSAFCRLLLLPLLSLSRPASSPPPLVVLNMKCGVNFNGGQHRLDPQNFLSGHVYDLPASF